jgi:tetratricopeptide (TPR) repeat protein
MQSNEHPEDISLYRYLTSNVELNPLERDSIRDHLAECAECRDSRSQIQSLIDKVRALTPIDSIPSEFWPKRNAEAGNSKYDFVENLRETIVKRQIYSVSAMSDELIACMTETDLASPALMDYFCQWMLITGTVHIGIAEEIGTFLDFAKTCLKKLPGPPRPFLSVIDCAHIHMAEGILDLLEERHDAARAAFDFIRGLKNELGDEAMLATATAYLGQTFRRQGKYDTALGFINEAIRIGRRADYHTLAADFQVAKGWLLFQLNESKAARGELLEAEVILSKADHQISLGNIKAALGRIERRSGEYEEAIRLFDSAIRHYSLCHPKHSNIARALVNAAFARRLKANHEEKDFNLTSARRLRCEALENLQKADEIYGEHRDIRGSGNALLTRAFVHFDNHAFDLADQNIKNAFHIASQKKGLDAEPDFLLMARAKTLESMVLNARCLEERDADQGQTLAECALKAAEDALRLAQKTEHNRLKARAVIWQGLVSVNRYFNDVEAGRRKLMEAKHLVKDLDNKDSKDWLAEDFNRLLETLESSGKPLKA